MPAPLPPAKNPCGSCPYRKDVPSGVWKPEEYEKLPPYDGETFEQPPGLFLCHRQDGHACAGWVATHDMHESLAFRLACLQGVDEGATDEWVDSFLDYTTDVPLFASGQEAHDHGMAEVAKPGPKARKVIDRVKAGKV